jgi:hypothetical protein
MRAVDNIEIMFYSLDESTVRRGVVRRGVTWDTREARDVGQRWAGDA